MKEYITVAPVWIRGCEVAVGSSVKLSDSQVKYMRHALTTPEELKAARVVLVQAIKAAPAAEAPAAKEPAVEAPKPVKRRKKGNAHGDVH
jgi:hypothetical protein